MKKRNCECCGSDDYELIFSDLTSVKTHQQTYRLEAFVVICKNCGYCFNSPCPDKTAMAELYSDYFSVSDNLPPAYSIDIRLETLKKYAGGNFVEVGGNQAGKFHDNLTKYFQSVKNVEPNRECSATLQTIDSLPESSTDVIAFYDVLEHVAEVKDFLSKCHSALKDNGVILIEVPNIKLYPKNLMLFVASEHLNHFSANTLARIASQCGFELIEISYNASRPFSFLAVFKKNKKNKNQKFFYNEYLDNLACLKGGVRQIDRVKAQLANLQNKIKELKGEKIVLWCVTDFLYRFLENYNLPENVKVVDSDPRKKHHLKVPVFLPTDCLDYIKDSQLLVIFSPRYSDHILSWIRQNIGREINLNNLEVIGCGPYGEPLQV